MSLRRAPPPVVRQVHDDVLVRLLVGPDVHRADPPAPAAEVGDLEGRGGGTRKVVSKSCRWAWGMTSPTNTGVALLRFFHVTKMSLVQRWYARAGVAIVEKKKPTITILVGTGNWLVGLVGRGEAPFFFFFNSSPGRCQDRRGRRR